MFKDFKKTKELYKGREGRLLFENENLILWLNSKEEIFKYHQNKSFLLYRNKPLIIKAIPLLNEESFLFLGSPQNHFYNADQSEVDIISNWDVSNSFKSNNRILLRKTKQEGIKKALYEIKSQTICWEKELNEVLYLHNENYIFGLSESTIKTARILKKIRY